MCEGFRKQKEKCLAKKPCGEPCPIDGVTPSRLIVADASAAFNPIGSLILICF